MDKVLIGLFSIGGVEFAISFVCNEDTLNDLTSIAEQYELNMIFVGNLDDGEGCVGVISTDKDSENIDINGFLRVIREQGCWFPDHVKFDDGTRMLTFYHKETLS